MFVGGNLGFWGVGGSLPWNTWTGANDGSPSNSDTVNTQYDWVGSTVLTVEVSAGTILSLYPKGTGVYAVAGTVSGKTITYGTPVLVNSNNGSYLYTQLCALSSGVALALSGGGTTSYAANVLTVSGTTVSVGTSGGDWSIGTSGIQSSYEIALTALTSTTAVVVFQTSSVTYGVVITISGTAVSYGARQTLIGSSDAGAPNLCTLTSSTALLLASVGGVNYAYVVTLSGSTLSIGSSSNAIPRSYHSRSSAINAANVVITILSGEGTGAAYIGVVTISGGVPTIGTLTEYSTNGGATYEALVIGYIKGGGVVGTAGRMFGYIVSGTTITLGSSVAVGTYADGVCFCGLTTMTELDTFVCSYATSSGTTAQGTSNVISL